MKGRLKDYVQAGNEFRTSNITVPGSMEGETILDSARMDRPPQHATLPKG